MCAREPVHMYVMCVHVCLLSSLFGFEILFIYYSANFNILRSLFFKTLEFLGRLERHYRSHAEGEVRRPF